MLQQNKNYSFYLFIQTQVNAKLVSIQSFYDNYANYVNSNTATDPLLSDRWSALKDIVLKEYYMRTRLTQLDALYTEFNTDIISIQ